MIGIKKKYTRQHISGHIKVAASPHSIYFTHLHRLVIIVRGSADEPAAALHRLKFGQGDSAGCLYEEETLLVLIGPDHSQILVAFLSQSGRDQSYAEGGRNPSIHFRPQLIILTLGYSEEKRETKQESCEIIELRGQTQRICNLH